MAPGCEFRSRSCRTIHSWARVRFADATGGSRRRRRRVRIGGRTPRRWKVFVARNAMRNPLKTARPKARAADNREWKQRTASTMIHNHLLEWLHSQDPVRWQSGRMRRSRKPLNLYGFREFESHPHRHSGNQSLTVKTENAFTTRRRLTMSTPSAPSLAGTRPNSKKQE